MAEYVDKELILTDIEKSIFSLLSIVQKSKENDVKNFNYYLDFFKKNSSTYEKGEFTIQFSDKNMNISCVLNTIRKNITITINYLDTSFYLEILKKYQVSLKEHQVGINVSFLTENNQVDFIQDFFEIYNFEKSEYIVNTETYLFGENEEYLYSLSSNNNDTYDYCIEKSFKEGGYFEAYLNKKQSKIKASFFIEDAECTVYFDNKDKDKGYILYSSKATKKTVPLKESLFLQSDLAKLLVFLDLDRNRFLTVILERILNDLRKDLEAISSDIKPLKIQLTSSFYNFYEKYTHLEYDETKQILYEDVLKEALSIKDIDLMEDFMELKDLGLPASFDNDYKIYSIEDKLNVIIRIRNNNISIFFKDKPFKNIKLEFDKKTNILDFHLCRRYHI